MSKPNYDNETRVEAMARGDGMAERHYDALKEPHHRAISSMPHELQAWYHQLLRTDVAADFLQGGPIQGQIRFGGNLLKSFYPNDYGTLYSRHFNHQLLAEDAAGNINSINSKQLYSLFPQETATDREAESRWPTVVLTSSHARGGALTDMTSITHGIEAMLHQCFKTNGHSKHFDPLQFEMGYFDDTKASPRDPKHQKLMIAFACDVEHNPFLNAASLLARVNELKEYSVRVASSAIHKVLGAPKSMRDSYAHVSPGAYRLAKSMLQCLVTEPERINPDFRGFLLDQPGLNDAPIRLRPDAVRVAQHLALIGYSKGGNVVSDAMRIMVDELCQQRINGDSLFEVPDIGRFDHPFGANIGYKQMHELATPENPLAGMRPIIENIPLLSIAALEIPMTKKMQLAGAHRVSVNNQRDIISGHTRLRYSKGSDEVIRVEGVSDYLGHVPGDALGRRVKKSYKKGYILEDENARRRIEEFACALYGAAAISHVQFQEDEAGRGKNRIIITSAAGTSDAKLLEHSGIVQKQMEAAGFTNVMVKPDSDHIVITLNEPLFVDNTLNPSSGALIHGERTAAFNQHVAHVHDNVVKLGTVFAKIRKNEPDLVINTAVDADIAAHAKKVLEKGKTRKSPPSDDAKAGSPGSYWLSAMDGISPAEGAKLY